MAITNGQFEVVENSRGPSMTIVESQVMVIAASFETKYGNP